MATSYTVNFTDPLVPSFVVNPYTVDGVAFPIKPDPSNLEPGATDAHSSFVIYGKGSSNYGERIQENILHLLENFSGATAPVRAVSGQLWFERRVFFHGSSTATAQWYVWVDDDGNPNGGTWSAITVVALAPSGIPSGSAHNYRFSGGVLYDGIAIPGHPLDGQWVPREYMEDTTLGAPNPAIHKPNKLLSVYDGVDWKYVNGIYAATQPPANPTLGSLWYDTVAPSSPLLKIYNGTAWDGLPAGAVQDLADLGITVSEVEINYLAGVSSNVQTQLDGKLDLAGGTMSGNINMNSVAMVSSLPAPVAAGDATRKSYVDAADIVSASYNPFSGVLTLTKGDASTLTAFGFSLTSNSGAYTPAGDELLSQLAVEPTTTEEAIRSLDRIVERRTTFHRKIITGTTGPTITVPTYEVGSNKLFVFVDGVKYYANMRGQQRVLFTTNGTGSPFSPEFLDCSTDPTLPQAGSPPAVYSFRVSVDGGANQTINVDSDPLVSEGNSFCEVVDTINSQLTGATASLEDSAIVISSDSTGPGSTISITDGDGLGSPDFELFANMAHFSSIEAATPGATYGYTEVGYVGQLATTITFTNALLVTNVVEVTVCGETGVPL